MTATACDVGRATAGEGNAPETLARRLRTHLQVVFVGLDYPRPMKLEMLRHARFGGPTDQATPVQCADEACTAVAMPVLMSITVKVPLARARSPN
jgi:hypothetical protein